MKVLLLAVGIFHSVMFAFGTIGVIDYHVCIKGAGQCVPVVRWK